MDLKQPKTVDPRAVSPTISSGVNMGRIYHILVRLCQEVSVVWLVGWLLFEKHFLAKKTVNFAIMRTWLGRGTGH